MRLAHVFSFGAPLLLAVAAACSGQSPAATGSGGSTTTSTAPSGTGGGCPADAHPDDAGACDTTLTWESLGTISPARHHHTTFVLDTKAGPFLYVTGGFSQTVIPDVVRAPIQADGSLGAWEPQTPYPTGRAGHMTVTGQGHVVSLGGFSGGTHVAEVLSAPVDDGGAIGAWTAQAPLPVPRMHGAALIDGDTIYVFGGLGTKDAVANVERATLAADGTIAAWEELDPLPAPRSHQAAVAFDGYVYLAGGLSGDPAGAYTDYKDVLRAPIQADGKLGAWESIATLPKRVDTAAAVVHDGFLYLVGGIEGILYVDHVRRARILDDHGLGPWEDSAPLPKGRGHVHQTPVYGKWMYSVGGSITNLVPIPDVFRGTFQ